jgi:hypothetical protein
MNLLLKILKISALVALIFVLAVLFAPTLKGSVVIIHFSTALRAWIFGQMILMAFAMMAHTLVGLRALPIARMFFDHLPVISRFAPTLEPLRC